MFRKLIIVASTIFLISTRALSEPRFEYLASISRPEDVEAKKTFFKKGIEAIVGKTEEEGMVNPYGVISDGEGRVYVTDTALGVVHLFDTKKKKYSQIYKVPGGRLLSPVTCALDFRGNLYVSDNVLHKIFIFNRKGKFISEIDTAQLINPTAIAVGKNLLLYCVDTNGHKVWVYSLGGAHRLPGWQFSFGKRGGDEGEFNYPSNIFVDSQGLVYVTDTMNFRIQVFDEYGKFIRKFGEIGDTPGYFSRPKGIAVDSEGYVFVVDALKETVEVFDREGKYVGFLGGKSGANPGEFSLPAGINIDEKNKIYVVDTHNRRIQTFRFLP